MADAVPRGGELGGRAILITRPASQCEALVRLVRAAGGEAVVFPTLEIVPAAPSAEAVELLQRLHSVDLAVFVSANAVACGMPMVAAAGGWPRTVRVAAVGRGTARVLREYGVATALAPASGAGSTALAALPELQDVAGWRVAIFRGVGGRESLAQRLRERGAQVSYVECYRRAAPDTDPEPLRARLCARTLAALTASSSQGLTNLVRMAGTRAGPVLLALPLFVIHANIADTAMRLGFREVRITDTSDAALVRGMISYFAPSAGAAGA